MSKNGKEELQGDKVLPIGNPTPHKEEILSWETKKKGTSGNKTNKIEK